jgi:hypothetical protein
VENRDHLSGMIASLLDFGFRAALQVTWLSRTATRGTAEGLLLAGLGGAFVRESPFGDLQGSEDKHAGPTRLPLSRLGLLSISIGLVVPIVVGLGYCLVLITSHLPPDDAEVVAQPAFLGYLVVGVGCCYGYVLCPVGAVVGVSGLLQTNRRRWPVLVGIATNIGVGNPFSRLVRDLSPYQTAAHWLRRMHHCF